MFIFSELSQHRRAYLVLACILTLFAAAMWMVWPYHEWQRLLILLFSASYFSWGVITHVHSTKLTPYVLKEYAAVSILGGLLLLLLTF